MRILSVKATNLFAVAGTISTPNDRSSPWAGSSRAASARPGGCRDHTCRPSGRAWRGGGRASSLTRRRIELADGDFIDLALGAGTGPRVLVIHGLEGDLDSHYAGTLLDALSRAGYSPIFMHLRGCSGEPNRLARSYHSGASEDLHEVLTHLARDPRAPRWPPSASPWAATCCSSIWVNAAASLETTRPCSRRGIAVSVPFVLRDAMLRLDLGASRLYRGYLIDKLMRAFRRKFTVLPCPLDLDIGTIHDFNQFDDRVTAPLCGFAGVFDYYSRASCRQFLPRITTATLIIHSRDDPFMFPATVPFEHELGPGDHPGTQPARRPRRLRRRPPALATGVLAGGADHRVPPGVRWVG